MSIKAGSVVAPWLWYWAKKGSTRAVQGAQTLGSSGNWMKRTAEALGYFTLADWIFDFLPDLDTNELARAEFDIEQIENGIRDGSILMPEHRRGDDPDNIPGWLITDLKKGRQFLAWDYFNRNFVNAVRKNERTKGFRGVGGRRQVQTRGNR